MNRSSSLFIGIAGWLLLTLIGCSRHFSAADSSYTQYQVNKDSVADPVAESIIKPYRDSLSEKMNVVIGTSAKELVKRQPESELGNFCADAFLKIARDITLQGTSTGSVHAVVVCIINYGGLRLPSLPHGEITVGKIFELLPFDNMIVVTNVTGDSLQAACDLIAKAGGWPVSGLKFKIQNNKAIDVMVSNEPLQRDRIYKVVTSDYVANGGDNMFMLKSKDQINTGLLMRDAMIDYIKRLGSPINAELQNRITL